MTGSRAKEAGALGVLLYHDVSDSGRKWAVPAPALETQLGRALELGCCFLSKGEVEERFRSRRGFPARSLCVHFDEARDGVYGNAWPVSERYSSFVTWDEIGEMAADPRIEIGSHGRTHRSLKRVSWWELWEELHGFRARIRNELGMEVRHFSVSYNHSYPWIRWLARWAGYGTFSLGGGGSTRGCRPGARYCLGR